MAPSPSAPARPGRASVNRRSFLATSGLVVAGSAALNLIGPAVASAAPASSSAATATSTGTTVPVILRRQISSVRAGEAFLLVGNGFASTSRAVAVLLPDGPDGPRPPTSPSRGAVALRVLSVTATQIVLLLPHQCAPGAYAVYVSSSDGTRWSVPFLANTARAWYCDTPRPTSGGRVTVYGADLRLGRSRPWVAVRTATGVRPVEVVAATPYSITFMVPRGLSGPHQLLVSNGHGGVAGVDGSLRLTIAAAPRTPTTVIDAVRDHGADPTGTHDATTALQAALTAAAGAAGGAQVTLRRGNYVISAKLSLPAAKGPVVISGAGRGRTTIVMSDDVEFTPSLPRGTPTDIYGVSAADDSGMLYLAPSQIPVEISGITFDTHQRRVVALELDASDNVTLTDIGVENVDYPQDVWLYVGCFGLLGQNLRNLTVQRCDFHTANGAFLIGVTDVVVQDSTFRRFYPRSPDAPNNPQHQADDAGIKVWGARRLTVRRNVFQRGSDTWYYARAVQTGALKLPVSVFGAADAAGIEDVFLGNNSVTGAGEPNRNCGESLVGDQINSVQGGRQLLSASGASATTISVATSTFASADDRQDPVGTTVVVLGGTGIGQLRKVVANTDTTLTVDEPWDVLPGNDSQFVVIALQQRQLYVGNRIRTSPKYLGNYGPSALCIAADNDFDATGAQPADPPGADNGGILFFGIATGQDPVNLDTCHYNQVVDNRVTAGVTGLAYNNFAGDDPRVPFVVGNRFARNRVGGGSSAVRFAQNYSAATTTVASGNLVVADQSVPSTLLTGIVQAPFDRTVYQGPAGGLQDGGTNTIVV